MGKDKREIFYAFSIMYGTNKSIKKIYDDLQINGPENHCVCNYVIYWNFKGM